MRDLDAIVVGLGGIGSAALDHLSGRGLRVLGLEQHGIGHALGSSHGLSRVIRKAYNEHPGYVPLLHRAYELWADLETTTGAALLTTTGAVHLGPPESAGVRGVLESVLLHDLAHERLTAAQVRERFPALVPAPGDIGVFEADAGVLAVERGVQTQVQRARERGAIVRDGVRVTAVCSKKDGAGVTTANGESLSASKVIVCAGPWLASLLPLEIPLTVTRQVQCWFEPRDRGLVAAGALPVFIHFVGGESFYGVPPGPTHESVKVCRHYGGAVTTPSSIDRAVHASDEEEVRMYVRQHLPAADGPMVASVVCMYTSTPDQHFVVGPAPGHPHVLVAGGFSGHGYKMAPVIGEVLAGLVADGGTEHDIALFDPRRQF